VVTDEGEGGLSLRQRTDAFTFDPDLSRSSCAGGAVRLHDDDTLDDPSIISADFRDTSTAAEVKKTSFNSPDLPNTNNNKNKLLCTGDHFRRSQDTKQPGNERVHPSACVCDREVVEVQNPISLHSPQIAKKEVIRSPLALPQVQRSAEGNTGSAEVQKNPPMRINTRDYNPWTVTVHGISPFEKVGRNSLVGTDGVIRSNLDNRVFRVPLACVDSVMNGERKAVRFLGKKCLENKMSWASYARVPFIFAKTRFALTADSSSPPPSVPGSRSRPIPRSHGTGPWCCCQTRPGRQSRSPPGKTGRGPDRSP